MAESRNQIWVGQTLYADLQKEQKGASMPVTIRGILEERNLLRKEKDLLLKTCHKLQKEKKL